MCVLDTCTVCHKLHHHPSVALSMPSVACLHQADATRPVQLMMVGDVNGLSFTLLQTSCKMCNSRIQPQRCMHALLDGSMIILQATQCPSVAMSHLRPAQS